MHALSLPTLQVSQRAINQVSLLGDYFSQHSRDQKIAACHVMSFVYCIAGDNASLPLLRNAIDTLCLAHLANKSAQVHLIHEAAASHTAVLSLLQRAVSGGASSQPSCGHRDTLASIFVAGLIPSLKIGDRALTLAPSPMGVHFQGAMSYLEAHGPAALDIANQSDRDLLRHLRLHGMLHHLARRKDVLWNKAEWRTLGVMPLPYIPGRVVAGFVATLPGLLERADKLVADMSEPSTRWLSECEDLITAMHQLQTCFVQPWLASTSCAKPQLLDASRSTAMIRILGGCSVLRDSPFGPFYDFTNSSHAFCDAYLLVMSLVSDCTLLRLLCAIRMQDPRYADSSLPQIVDVEFRAHAYATELCRYTNFLISRSLPAVTFLVGALGAACSFFRCSGALQESEWCDSMLSAVNSYLGTLRSESPTTLCPVGDFIASLPGACTYGSRVSRDVGLDGG